MEAPCCNPQDTKEKMPTSQCQTLQRAPEVPSQRPDRSELFWRHEEGLHNIWQVVLMSWRISVYVSCQSTPGMNWNSDLIIPFTSVCLTKVQHKPSDSESDTQAHAGKYTPSTQKKNIIREKKPVSFSRPGIWNLICDLTEKLPSDLCWVHSLTISVCNFDIWLQSKDSWSHTSTRFSFHGLLLQTLSCFLHVFQPPDG